jgi:hypothetical protein
VVAATVEQNIKLREEYEKQICVIHPVIWCNPVRFGKISVAFILDLYFIGFARASSTEKASMAHVLLNSIRKYSVQGNTIKDHAYEIRRI